MIQSTTKQKRPIIVRIAGRAQSLQRGSNGATAADRRNGGQSAFKEIAGPLTRGAPFRGGKKSIPIGKVGSSKDCKIKRIARFRNFVPKFLSAHCFRSLSNVRSRRAGGVFSDYRSLSMLRAPSPATCCKSKMAGSSLAQLVLRCVTRTAFLVLRDNVRLPIVV
jgi:hypothetical protein